MQQSLLVDMATKLQSTIERSARLQQRRACVYVCFAQRSVHALDILHVLVPQAHILHTPNVLDGDVMHGETWARTPLL